MNLSKDSTSEVLTLLKNIKPRIHCISTSCDIGDLSQGILTYNGIPVIAHGIEEVSEITSKSNGLIISLATLDNSKILAMDKSLRAARKNNVSVVLDICEANLSSYRRDTALSLINRYNIDIIKGTSEEVKSLMIRGKNKESRITSDFTKDDLRQFARQYKVLLVICGDNFYITDGYSEFNITNGKDEFTKLVNIQSILTGMLAVGVSVFKKREEKVQGALIAALTFAVAQDLAVDRAQIESQSIMLKNYLFDEISNMDEEKIINYGKLFYEFKSKAV